MVRCLEDETEFLMAIYPNMFEVELIENLLKELDSFEEVRKRLDEFSFQPDSDEADEIQEEFEELKEFDDANEESKESEFDLSLAVQG